MSHGRLLPLSWLLLIAAGCALNTSNGILPGQHHVMREQLMVYSDFALPRSHRLLDELVAQRGDLSTRLQVPQSDEPIYVYLFEGRDTYQAFVEHQFPELPDRRAIFVETDTRLSVYAYWGDHVAQDLRHEITHGYLHAVVPNLPLWLDEGLAEYFETGRHSRGLNVAHVQLLQGQQRLEQWHPDLERLEKLTDVAQMRLEDYAEAWLWVHFYLETSEARLDLLRNYIARLRMTGSAPPFSQFVLETEAAAGYDLRQHLASIGQQ